MTTQIYTMTPDFTPFMRMMQLQTRFAIEASQGMMKLAMMPWTGLPAGFGSICTPMGSVSVAVKTAKAEEAPVAEEPAASVVEAVAVEVTEEPAPVEPVAETVETVAEAAETVTETVEAVAEVAEEPAPVAETVETVAETVEPVAEHAVVKPAALKAPKGEADDLTALNGVGPKLAEALNAEGIYHYAQIAAWTEANVAWADENLAGVRGRASRNGWVAQAADLVKN